MIKNLTKVWESNQLGGEFSRDSLFCAAKFLSKKIDALVTTPINKIYSK